MTRIQSQNQSQTQTQTHTHFTFSSSSYSSVTDSSGTTYTESITSNPSGTTIHKTTQRSGEAPTSEITRLTANNTQQVEGVDGEKRIEDVTDADREYEERIEDEYAKREGGAWRKFSSLMNTQRDGWEVWNMGFVLCAWLVMSPYVKRCLFFGDAPKNDWIH